MVVSGTQCKPAEILLVEDNPVDVLLTKEALNEGKICNRLHVVEDGEEATDFLHRRDKFSSAPVPDVILLDLNLPKKDGREVLAEIKQDPALKHIPVIILTTSQDQKDILHSYQLQANCFVTKPVDMDQFHRAVKCVGDFWFSLVKLPTK